MRDDSGFDGKFWSHNRRNAENGGNIPIFTVVRANTPSEALLGLWMACDGEHLHVTLPSYLAPENLFDRHSLNVRGVAAVNGFDRFAEFGNVGVHERSARRHDPPRQLNPHYKSDGDRKHSSYPT